MQKQVIVKLIDEAKEQFLELQKITKEEKRKKITNSFNQTLLRSIEEKIALLKTNYDCGTHIPKANMPRKYVKLYEITNLWKINLSGYWRMIYTIRQTQRDETKIEVLSIVLDVLDIISHEKYNKIFNYKKR